MTSLIIDAVGKLAYLWWSRAVILKDFDDAGPRAALLKAGIRSVTRDRLNGGQQHPLLALKPPVWRNAVVARQLQHRFPARLVRESSARCPTVETMFANTLEAQPADIAEGLGGVAGLHLARHVLGLVRTSVGEALRRPGQRGLESYCDWEPWTMVSLLRTACIY